MFQEDFVICKDNLGYKGTNMMLLVNTEFVILVYVKPLMPYDNIDFDNL